MYQLVNSRSSRISNMSNRGLRAVFAILIALLTVSTPVQAGPVVVSEVKQILVNLRNPAKLTLGPVSKYDGKIIWKAGEAQPSESLKPLDAKSIEAPATTSTPANGPSSLFASLAISPDWQEPTIEQIRSGSVEGAVCDCGEIILAGGNFPKWPLLFLAAIPLFFIPGDDIEIPLNPTPTPPVVVTPFTTPVPEPVSLLLFGTGLAAFGVRLRRRKVKNPVNKNQTR